MTAGTTRSEADDRLVSRLAGGELDSAAELYDRYAPRVLGLARRILRDESEAEDVVQDVFSQAWRTAARFDPSRGTVAGWLLVMTRSRALDRLRARQARPDLRADADVDTFPAQGAAMPDVILSEQQAVRIRQALVALPEPQRIALELAYYEGLTQSEIAARLTEPLGTIKTRIRTALATLRERLRP